MAELIAFLTKHWLLSGAFLLALFAYLMLELRLLKGSQYSLSCSAVVDLMNRANAKIIDLRSKEDFALGHLLGATQVLDFNNLPKDMLKFKNKPLILVCAKGVDSSSKVELLKKHGFSEVFSIAGGMEAWRKENLPTTKN